MKINYKQSTNCCLIALLLCLAGCSQSTNVAKNDKIDIDSDEYSLTSKKSYQQRLTKWLHPHKIDVQQGNVITADMLEKLHIGMTKQQVKYLLGTSLLSESASKNQWLYVFNNATGGVVKEEQTLILSFNEDGMLDDIKEEKVVG